MLFSLSMAGPDGSSNVRGSAADGSSGLLDIRRLAAHRGLLHDQDRPSVDHLLLAGDKGGLDPTLTSPVMMALAPKAPSMLRRAVVAASLLLCSAVVVLAAVALLQDRGVAGQGREVVLPEAEPLPMLSASPSVDLDPVLQSPRAPLSQVGPIAAADFPGPDSSSLAATDDDLSSQLGEPPTGHARLAPRQTVEPRPSTGPAPMPAEPARSSTSGDEQPAPQGRPSLAQLIEAAAPASPSVPPTPRPARPEPRPEDALPLRPTRQDVMAAMSRVAPSVRRCSDGRPGQAEVTVVIRGATGRALRATVDGQFAGTSVGSCVARAARQARFDRFGSETFTVRYPFLLR